MKRNRVILLHRMAPAKPPEGAACNGCGVCCAVAPCPLGMLVSRRRGGRCAALVWDADQSRYRCGVVVSPARWLPWLPRRIGSRLAARWISAARGCDSDVEAA